MAHPWYNYYSDGQNPTSCCDSGEYDYFYDALGNVNGVLDDGGHYYRWEMDAFGNDLPGGNAFLPMDQPGAKEHLTGKMFDTTTGLYYFHARWYDPQVGRFVSRDPIRSHSVSVYVLARNLPTCCVDPTGQQSLDILEAAFPCARGIRNYARNAALDCFGREDQLKDNAPENAFLHCVLSCRAYEQCGPVIAGELDTREWGIFSQGTDSQNRMDKHNNAAGRACGRIVVRLNYNFIEILYRGGPETIILKELKEEGPCITCETCCRAKMRLGDLVYIPSPPDGPTVPVNLKDCP